MRSYSKPAIYTGKCGRPTFTVWDGVCILQRRTWMIALIRTVMGLVPELRGKFYLSMVLKVIESIFTGAPYGILILTLNDLLSGTLTYGSVMVYTAGVAVCFACHGIIFYAISRIAYPAGTELAARIRLLVGEHLSKLSMGYFNQKRTGDLNAMIADELMMVSLIPSMVFPQFISAIVLPVVFSIFLLAIDWRLTLVALSVCVIAIPVFMVAQRIMRTGVVNRSNSLIDISSRIIEYVQGMEVAKAFKQTGKQFSTLTRH